MSHLHHAHDDESHHKHANPSTILHISSQNNSVNNSANTPATSMSISTDTMPQSSSITIPDSHDSNADPSSSIIGSLFKPSWRLKRTLTVGFIIFSAIFLLYLNRGPAPFYFEKRTPQTGNRNILSASNDGQNSHSANSQSSNTLATSTHSEPSPQGSALNARTEYDIFAVADRDTHSYIPEQKIWASVLVQGKLKRHPEPDQDGYVYTAEWTKSRELRGKMVEGERGMELSELKFFQNRLLTCDDRTGIVFEITDDNKVIARHVLTDGNGNNPKGFKCEWMTVKDGKLVVGSIGKEWTSPKGEIIGYTPMWIKTIDKYGKIENIDWIKPYEALRKAVGVPFPGYMIHEAIEWSDYHNKWFILPRRVSNEPYDDEKDVERGSNLMLVASPDFSSIEKIRVGSITPTRGFSTFKFVPDRPSEIVAIKSEETVDGKFQSHLTVFTIDGKVLMPETKITDEKLEGLHVQ